MVIRSLITKFIREDVEKGEYSRALLQASADLEFSFFSKLLFEKGIKSSLMRNWTLGKYIEWICELELIDKKYEQLLRDFNELRNLVVHRRYTIHNVVKNLDEVSYLANIIIAVCDFIDSFSVTYKSNKELETEYSKLDKKLDEKYGRIFKKNRISADFKPL